MSRVPVRPFLIERDDTGAFRLSVRQTRFNSQNYPIVTTQLQSETFESAKAARTYAKEHFGAEAGQFASS